MERKGDDMNIHGLFYTTLSLSLSFSFISLTTKKGGKGRNKSRERLSRFFAIKKDKLVVTFNKKVC